MQSVLPIPIPQTEDVASAIIAQLLQHGLLERYYCRPELHAGLQEILRKSTGPNYGDLVGREFARRLVGAGLTQDFGKVRSLIRSFFCPIGPAK